MAKLLQIRRGTTSQHSSFTGAEGEITVDTDKDTIVVHDGSTAAGFPVAPNASPTFTGSHIGIPSVTTANRPGEVGGTNASVTAVVGMIIFNSTLGILQQFGSYGWASIEHTPTVASLNYPGDDTSLDTVGEFNLSCTTQSSTTVLVPGSTMPSVGQVVKGTGISAPVNNLTCGLTNTDATVTAASTTGLVVGMTVSEFTGVPSRATILSIITDTSFELSANATATNASAVLSFNTTVESVSGTTSFVITPTATASATVSLTFNTQTLVITGTNFQTGATVTIDGTAPSTVTRDSSTQITVTGTPAKTAGTKVDGLVVTNTSGLSASINVDYSALPAWTTASGNVLNTFAQTISTIDLAATNATSYAIISGALPTGLSMSTSTGDITGTMSGSQATYNFTVNATDAEAQSSPRLFNIILAAPPTGTGGTITTYSGYRVHTFLTSGTFTPASAFNVDMLIIGGGGSGGRTYWSGGGGAGGMLEKTGVAVTNQGYTITVGNGAASESQNNHTSGLSGYASSVSIISGGTAFGGGGGGAYNNSVPRTTDADGNAVGSGGGGGAYDDSGQAGTSGQGSAGGTGSANEGDGTTGGGGGGKGGAGEAGANADGGAGGDGATNAYRTGVAQGYAAGGGASQYYPQSGGREGGAVGGVTLGGAGGSWSATGGAGVANTGSGGGASGANGESGHSSGAGGSGIVVIRYAV
jgi:hypothetical protein